MTPPPNFSDKVTDVLIKLFITGSGGSALYFLYINELPKAAIAALVSGGAALFTSFGEGLMGKLKGGMKIQGEAVGDVTAEAVGNVRDLTWARLSGLSKQYQEALKAHCYAVEVEGFQDLPGLALEDVFVPLRIESTEYRLGESDGPKAVWDFLPKRYQKPEQNPHRRMVILAPPGYGKTTLMRHLTLRLVTDPPEQVAELMPVLLRFREVYPLMQLPTDAPAGDAEAPALSLPALVSRHFAGQPAFKDFKDSSTSKTWLTDQLNRGTCLVMFDGLDEVPKTERDRVRQWVDYQMQFYKSTQFVITSRPHGFELSPDDPSHPITVDTKLKVLDFTPDQKQDFVEKWYRTLLWRLKWEPLWQDSQRRAASSHLSEDQARLSSEKEAQESASDLMRQIVNNPSINDLARNPLLITMIASTHRAQTVLPKRRVELYDKIFDLLLGTRPYAKKMPLTLTATRNKVVLQELAWRLVNAEATQFTQRQCNFWIADVLNRCTSEAWLPEQFLTEMTDIAGMIVEKERDYYEFAHQTFQEYLAAKHLREQDDGEATLKAKITNDRWQEVTRFYAALGDATPIIEGLLAEETSEYTLLLARRCMEEGRELEATTSEKLEAALQKIFEANQIPVESQELVTFEVEGSFTLGTSQGESHSWSATQGISDSWTTTRGSSVSYTQGTSTSLTSTNLIELAKVRLAKRFQNLLTLSETSKITSNYITRREYEIFLVAQSEGQFHSTAQKTLPVVRDGQVTGISWQDACWFCAWLSTQTNLKEEGKVFVYRLPTREELEQVPGIDLRGRQPWLQDPDVVGNALLVVRENLPEYYKALLNYLANGLWKDANEETLRVMEKVAGDFLSVEKIKKFPSKDLRIIDHLWVKFSGGRFGFSVQKRIYLETGNPLDGEYHSETFSEFIDKMDWIDRIEGRKPSYNLSAPVGSFPRTWDYRTLPDMDIETCSLLSRSDL